MTSKHTEGPWQAIQMDPRKPWYTIRDSHNIYVGEIEDIDATVKPNMAANARLIAAAPDLLWACQCILDDLRDMRCGGPEMSKLFGASKILLKNAIGKATTEQESKC